MLFAVTAGWGVATAQGTTGAIRGAVIDRDFGAPLPGVHVSAIGAPLSAVTAEDGNFLIERVPPGMYSLAFAKDGYERQVVTGVVVLSGQLADVRIELPIEVLDMEELVVTGGDLLADTELSLLEVRATAVNLQDAISADVMRKAGASDVAGALKLVVGTSVVGGKYATVRGLSDRYTGTTMNGVRLPSADPRRRAVQVDLFPTDTLESLTVTKTFTPDLLGDFTGGAVDIKTRSIPEGFVFAGSFGVEHNSEATGQSEFLTYRGGGIGTWSLAGKDHDLPVEARGPLPPGPPGPFPPSGPPELVAQHLESAAAWDGLVRSFQPAMGVSRAEPDESRSYSLVIGDRFPLGGERTIGAIGCFSYSHKYDFYKDGQNNGATVNNPDEPLRPGRIRRDTRGLDEVLLGALASVVYRAGPRHGLGLRWVKNQAVEDEARFQAAGSNSVEQNQSLHYTERSVGSFQLHGDHRWEQPAFAGLLLDWVGSYNVTRQDEPDVRFFRNIFDRNTLSARQPSNSTEVQNTRRIFREVSEDNIQGAFNLTLPFRRKESDGKVKLGVYLDLTDRDYTQRSFTYQFATQQGPMAAQNLELSRFLAASISDLWTDVFLDPERIGLAGNRCPVGQPAPNCNPPTQMLWYIKPLNTDVNYTGEQQIEAAYAMAEFPLTAKLRFIGGARYETTKLEIVPDNPVSGQVEVVQVQPSSGDRAVVLVPQDQTRVDIDEPKVLPSLGLVYAVSPHMSVRLSGTRTLARSTFRELAPVATEEFIFGDEFVGNPALTLSDIANYDARWEWFRKPGEVLAASVFYKRIRDPIELISLAAGGRSFIQPINYEQGEVQGFEVEARVPLGVAAKALEGLTVGANYSGIDSEVQVPAAEQNALEAFGLDEPSRRLQGQPEYLFNASVTWDGEKSGTSVGVFYNKVGETLQTGAARGAEDGVPNVFEKPYDTLDLSFSKRLPQWPKNFSLTARAKNLLGSERSSVFRTPDGSEVIKTLRDTASIYGLSFGMKW